MYHKYVEVFNNKISHNNAVNSSMVGSKTIHSKLTTFHSHYIYLNSLLWSLLNSLNQDTIAVACSD